LNDDIMLLNHCCLWNFSLLVAICLCLTNNIESSYVCKLYAHI